MLTYYRSIGGKLNLIDEYIDGCWISAIAPTPQELLDVSRETGLPLDLLQYPLDPDERARFERDDGHVLVVLQTSKRLNEEGGIPYDTVPLGILHTDHCIVTVCSQDNPAIQDVTAGLVRQIRTAKKNRLTLQIFLRAAQRFLIDLRRIDKMIDAAEDRLESATRNQELLDLLNIEKSLVYFKTALKANEVMMERLKRERLFDMYEDDQDLLNDVIIENQQAVEMTDIAQSILGVTMNTFAAVINNNVNGVVRILTVTTILVAIPTLVTSIFGMNVPLPAQGREWAVWVVLVLAFGISVGVGLLFRKLRWL
ncbi:magnesium transporter CorA family protein [Deinococcus yavapaiensis]|uniref:Magnesium transporter n=1 Tax=Deinococcus yavapaiensis KR-236 TaxID=694435 RepID=A0A318SEF9_9DEIO|nr:magnesium transporter CorA family protein [Deinococcus yavapaiensis]PYE51138.1 magnesium transporter [Deinococcus yavapaiensis KR-236]